MVPRNHRHPGRICQQRAKKACHLAKFRGQGGRRQVSGDQDVVGLQTCNSVDYRRQAIELEPSGSPHEQFDHSQGASSQ